MSEFILKPAKKEAIPSLIGLWGASGSGKTYSAIVLARGIVGPSGKIAVIDTENGRSKFYSDLGGGWDWMDMQPPFTPERYTAAFKACEDQGADIIVVDSMSHVWSGAGGILDQVDEKPDSSGLSKWKAPKMQHHRMMNTLLRSTIPVIFCIREKEGTKQIKENGKTVIISTGPAPISEKNFVYEMTLDLRMTKDGRYDLEKSKTVPKGLREIITADGRVDQEMGKKIAQWAGAGVPINPEEIRKKQEHAINIIEKEASIDAEGSEAASKGVESYKAWLDRVRPEDKEHVKKKHKEWSLKARAVDEGNVNVN